MRKNLFVCSTPYQVFNAINIQAQMLSGQDTDVLILNISPSCGYLLELCRKTKLFHQVYRMEAGYLKTDRKWKYYCNRIEKAVRPGKYLENRTEQYEHIYIVGTEGFSKAVYYFFSKKNRHTRLSYYEDGVGSYTTVLTESQKKLRNIVFQLIYGFEIRERCGEMLVYEPECVSSRYPRIKVKKIPYIPKNGKFAEELKQWYFHKNQEKPEYLGKIVFFDSNWNEPSLDALQREVAAYAGANYKDFYIKLHPSSQKGKYGERQSYIETYEGFESLALRYRLEDTVLISVASTACIVDRIIYQESPYVIYLYQMAEAESKKFKLIDGMLQKLAEREKKLYFPKSMEEVQMILDRIKREKGE